MNFKNYLEEAWTNVKANPGETAFKVIGTVTAGAAAVLCGKRKAKALLWVLGSEFGVLLVKDAYDKYVRKENKEEIAEGEAH